MRVLFLESHPMWIHGLPNGFRDMGHDVLVSGPIDNKNLSSMISEFQPDLIITIGWGPENSSIQKQDIIRDHIKSTKIPHVYWATEDPTHTQSFTIPFLKRVQPDFVFTICSKNVAYYESLNINAAHLDFAYHPKVSQPTKPCDTYKGRIAVVANAYPNKLKFYPNHYRHESLRILVKPLLDKNIRVDFYGKYWENMELFLGHKIPEDWIHGYVPYTETNKVYSSNDIIIGIQNHPTQLTQRIYEILGCGGFLLTNNTPEVNRLFKANQDLAVSSSPEETVQLVRYYLDNPEQRKLIQTQGQQSVDHHTYSYRAEYIIKTLNERGIFAGKRSKYKLNLMESDSFIHNHWELYTVCNGDTLWRISKTFGTSVEEIMKLNNLTSDFIEAGQLIKIRKLTISPKNSSSVLISSGNTTRRCVALTYDAGDGAQGTPRLLDILKKHGVKASFFLTGRWAEKFPDISKRIVDEGHELGNHSFSHPDLTSLNHVDIIDEIKKAEIIINKITNYDCRPLFRPPFGAWNKDTLTAAGEAGYQYCVYWSLDTIDWKLPPVGTIVQRIMENVKSNDIILMHLEYINTAEATDIVISNLKSLGYEFIPVTDMLKYREDKKNY